MGVIVRSGVFGNPVLSPDGKRIVVDLFEGGNQDIWTIDVSTGQLNRITFDAAIDHFPIWSPDGHRIAFESHRGGGGGYTLYVKSPTETERLLARGMWPDDWSHDGRYILCPNVDPKTGWHEWVVPLSGEQPVLYFQQTPAFGAHAKFSPDDQWVAYVSGESGRDEVYVRRFEGAALATGPKWQISIDGGTQPAWRGDGRELYYISADNKLMAVPVSAGAVFHRPACTGSLRSPYARTPRPAQRLCSDR